jgi:imidazolonepropionase-like amidohydrolase
LLGARHARETLQAGFTTVHDVGCFRAFADVALRDAINRGDVPGPRMSAVGAYITIPGGGGEVTGFAPDVVVPADMRAGVVLDAAVVAAAAHGSWVTAHAHGAAGIRSAIPAGVQGIEHASLIDDEGIRLAKAHGVYLDMDMYNGDYIEKVGRKEEWSADILRKNLDTTDAQREGFRKAAKAGVKLAFGTDAGVYPHGKNARRFKYMVRYGMSPMQAIQAATVTSAAMLGWSDRVGALSPGHYADMIAVAKNPLLDISALENVDHVMKGGVIIR